MPYWNKLFEIKLIYIYINNMFLQMVLITSNESFKFNESFWCPFLRCDRCDRADELELNKGKL